MKENIPNVWKSRTLEQLPDHIWQIKSHKQHFKNTRKEWRSKITKVNIIRLNLKVKVFSKVYPQAHLMREISMIYWISCIWLIYSSKYDILIRNKISLCHNIQRRTDNNIDKIKDKLTTDYQSSSNIKKLSLKLIHFISICFPHWYI